MNFSTYIAIFLFWSLNCTAQVFDVETIKYEGPPSKRINLVILSEGYQTTELDKFITDATEFANEMFSQSPFLEYRNYFNVYAIKVPSNESGADHPGDALDVAEPASPIKEVDTYFNATFDSFGFHRLLFYGIDGVSAGATQLKINAVLADNFPEYDQALLLVNTDVYGGSGGTFAMSSLAPSANEIAIHELGHSLFQLKDEYYPGDNRLQETINATQDNDAATIKWKNWLNTDAVGIYPYGNSGQAATWYRPHQDCKMRYLDSPFCAVCKEGMIEKIHSLVTPIDDFTPNESTLTNPEFPLNFNLSLILPIPNTLATVWTLNGMPFANNTTSVNVLDNDIVEGDNTLTATLTDESPMLRLNAHETIHITTVTWTITAETLSVNTIATQENSYTVSLFPNPTSSFLNLRFESATANTLRATITAIDGKLLQDTTLSNLENTTLDVSAFASGIYTVSFFDGPTLLTSRKLIKH